MTGVLAVAGLAFATGFGAVEAGPVDLAAATEVLAVAAGADPTALAGAVPSFAAAPVVAAPFVPLAPCCRIFSRRCWTM